MKRAFLAIFLVAISSASMGCNAHVYSPPARIAPHEASKPVSQGETSGGVAVSAADEFFGIRSENATLRLRHGVSEHSEMGMDVNLTVLDDSEAAADLSPYIWSARAGGKWAPEPLGDYMSLIYGVGGGTSEGGQFISPDLGVVAAFENRYLVPYFSVNGFVSEPIDAHPVDVSTKDEGLGTHVMSAKTTWGATFAGGVKWPIRVADSTIAPILGLNHTEMTDGDETASFLGLSLGVDMTFN